MKLLASVVLAVALIGCDTTPSDVPVSLAADQEPSPSPSPTPTPVKSTPAPAVTVTERVTEVVTVTPEPAPEPTPVYVAPDPVSVKWHIRGLWTEVLGRTPSDDEMDGWVGFYLQLHKESWHYGWDADARFMGQWQQEYSGELDLIQDRADAARNQELWRESMETMSCAAAPDQPQCVDR